MLHKNTSMSHTEGEDGGKDGEGGGREHGHGGDSVVDEEKEDVESDDLHFWSSYPWKYC